MGCLKCTKKKTTIQDIEIVEVKAEIQAQLMDTLAAYLLENEKYPRMLVHEVHNREGDHKGHRYFYFPDIDDLHIDLGIVR